MTVDEKGQAPVMVEGWAPEAVPGGHPMEIWISYVLRVGVTIAGIIIFAGVIAFLVVGARAGDPHTYHDVIHDHARALSLGSVFRGLGSGHALDIVNLGLIALILTPVLRVAMTVLLFLAQRDRVFTLVTTVVLAVLVLGLAGVAA